MTRGFGSAGLCTSLSLDLCLLHGAKLGATQLPNAAITDDHAPSMIHNLASKHANNPDDDKATMCNRTLLATGQVDTAMTERPEYFERRY